MAERGKILHFMAWDKKFVPPFIAFVGEHFAIEEHRFIVHGPVVDGHLPQGQGVIHYPHLLKQLLPLTAEMRAARKIIIHGLFSSHLLYLLMLQPWLLKKCYWTIWGGDLYVHQADIKDWRWRKNEWIRRLVISRLAHFITHIRGDYELAQQWYGAKGQWHECFMYPSNIYKKLDIPTKFENTTNILVGNSADPTNNHVEVFEQLAKYKNEDIIIYCPLSYGDMQYAEQVVKKGEKLFGNKFIPLLEFMLFAQYLELLGQIDVAIFAHKRQQAMGNTINLLGLGKKIYMRTDVTPWAMLEKIGIKVYNVAEIDLIPIDRDCQRCNQSKIKSNFSEKNLINGLSKIFNE